MKIIFKNFIKLIKKNMEKINIDNFEINKLNDEDFILKQYFKINGKKYFTEIKIEKNIENEINNLEIKDKEYIGGLYYKDENNIYFLKNIIYGADLETFQVLEYFYSKDKNNVYYQGKIINADPKTCKIDGVYLEDKNSIFIGFNQIKKNFIQKFYEKLTKKYE